MRSPPPSYDQSIDAEGRGDFTNAHASDGLTEKAMLQARSDLEAAQPRLPTDDASSGQHAAEYKVPARTKYTYLSLYFGLNLGLTLFNKAILGKVRCPGTDSPSKDDADHISLAVCIPLAVNRNSYLHSSVGLFHFPLAWPFPSHQTLDARKPHSACVFRTLYRQYCHFKCLAVSDSALRLIVCCKIRWLTDLSQGNGFCFFSSNHAIYHPYIYYSHLPHMVLAILRHRDLSLLDPYRLRGSINHHWRLLFHAPWILLDSPRSRFGCLKDGRYKSFDDWQSQTPRARASIPNVATCGSPVSLLCTVGGRVPGILRMGFGGEFWLILRLCASGEWPHRIPPQHRIATYEQAGGRVDDDYLCQPEAVSHRRTWHPHVRYKSWNMEWLRYGDNIGWRRCVQQSRIGNEGQAVPIGWYSTNQGTGDFEASIVLRIRQEARPPAFFAATASSFKHGAMEI